MCSLLFTGHPWLAASAAGLVVVVLLLAGAALVKYIAFERGRPTP